MFMQKKLSLKPFHIIYIITGLLLALCIILSIRAFRPVLYIVYAEDEIYEEYIKDAPLLQKDLNLIFVKTSEKEEIKQKAFGPIFKTAGNLQPYKDTPLIVQKYEKNQKFYILASEVS